MRRYELKKFEWRAIKPLLPSKAGVGAWLMDSITDAYSGDVRMIDAASVRGHHSATTLKTIRRHSCHSPPIKKNYFL